MGNGGFQREKPASRKRVLYALHARDRENGRRVQDLGLKETARARRLEMPPGWNERNHPKQAATPGSV